MRLGRWILGAVVAAIAGCPGSSDKEQSVLQVSLFPEAGAGRIQSTPSGIDCPGTCSATFDRQTSVSLNVVSAGGFAFDEWSEECGGNSSSCAVDMTRDTHRVTANFDVVAQEHTVRIAFSGTGQGLVDFDLADTLPCGEACERSVPPGTMLSLTALAADGSRFRSWTGDCGTTPENPEVCGIVVDRDLTVTVAFDPALPDVTLTVDWSGLGGIEISGPSQAAVCSENICSASMPVGTTVSIIAVPDVAGAPIIWSSNCAGATNECVIEVLADTVVSLAFDPQTEELRVEGSPDGLTFSASVSIGNPIACSVNPNGGAQCFEVPFGADVTVSVTEPVGYKLDAFSGACAGAICSFVMDGSALVVAHFFQLIDVTVTVTGLGEVVDLDSGQTCPANTICTFAVREGSLAALVATPDVGQLFTRWLCPNPVTLPTDPCEFVVDAQGMSAEAQFDPTIQTLTVQSRGDAVGNFVLSDGQVCTGGGPCVFNFPYGMSVNVTRTAPPADIQFWGWGVDCTGTDNICTVVMDGTKNVDGYFGQLCNNSVLDFSNGHVVSAYDPALNQADFAIDLWMALAGTPSGTVASRYNPTVPNGCSWTLELLNGFPAFCMWSGCGGAMDCFISTQIVPAGFHNVSVRYSGGLFVGLYIDGLQAGGLPPTPINIGIGDAPVALGTQFDGAGLPVSGFGGLIASFRMSSNASVVPSGTPFAPATDPSSVVVWPLYEGTGIRASDVVGNINGALMGATWAANPNACVDSD